MIIQEKDNLLNIVNQCFKLNFIQIQPIFIVNLSPIKIKVDKNINEWHLVQFTGLPLATSLSYEE